MDLSKSYEFFQPDKVEGRIHIIGCGSVGSTLAELLARYGLRDITLYDFDHVEKHNIVNQMFTNDDIGVEKVVALAKKLIEIDPELEDTLKLVPEGYKGQKLSGYVFLCVDNIELRRMIAESNRANPFIKAMFDFRTGLTDAQHYAARWNDLKEKEAFISSMQFTHEEASRIMPVSACNVALGVAATVRLIVTLGVCNFIDLIRKGTVKKVILADTENWMFEGI